MARMETSVTIRRPVEEVFDFVTNVANVMQWRSGIVELRQTSEGPMGVGATMLFVTRVMGRQIKMTMEITEYEPNRKYSTKSISGPMPAQASYTFKSVNGGTRLTFVAEAQPSGFFKLVEPLVVRMQQRRYEAELGKLKELLEART